MRPLLLDLFSGAGGAAVGYHRAGFDVIGVDNRPQPHYPFEFHQADALEWLTYEQNEFDAIHSSPPCQRYSLMQAMNGRADRHPDLVRDVRRLLKHIGLPYVIENVVGAPLENPIQLCGEMFGLGVIRHRLFETNIFMWQPPHGPHRGRVAGYRHGTWTDGPYHAVYGNGGGKGTAVDWQRAMGINWIPVGVRCPREIAEAIPPAYTEYVGAQLLAHMSEVSRHG